MRQRASLFARLSAGIALCAFPLLFSACGTRESAVEAGNRTQTLLVGNLSEPNDLDPQIADSQQTFNLIMALMEGLAQYDARTCEPVPAVAERWDVSPDKLAWTFHLRKNAVWSNGDPVTANDFVWSYQRMLTPSLGAEYAGMLFILKNGERYYKKEISDFSIVGVHAPDPHTLTLTLTHPVPYLPKLVCHAAWYPVHRATLEKFGRPYERGSAWTRPGNFVGNGYFDLVEWIPNKLIRMKKSQTYWDRNNVRLESIVFLPIENTSTEESMFRAGQLHITATIPITKIAVYQSDPTLRPMLNQDPMLATYFYRFNVTKAPLNDARVRRALTLSVNRKQIVDHVTKGGQIPAGHLTLPNIAGFTAKADVPYDPAQARQLLAEAGFPGGKGFPKVELLYNTNEGHRQIAEAIQQMWRRELGIEISLFNQEAKVYVETMRTLSYHIARYAWVGDYLDPSTFLDTMTTANGNNQTGWSNAEYDRLIAAAETAGNETERYAFFQRCEEIIAAENPILPIYFYVRNNLQRPEVKGWYSNLLDLHPLKGVFLQPQSASGQAATAGNR
ncbi:MAG TPA: peptide ABC transporter substrate-binding protein [Opitutaceae bacterium]|nr:peptide ABC transporter substrate-binding protein [Opitutaceae bacterium]